MAKMLQLSTEITQQYKLLWSSPTSFNNTTKKKKKNTMADLSQILFSTFTLILKTSVLIIEDI